MKNNEESCSDIFTEWAFSDFFGKLRELKIDRLLTRGIDFVIYGLIELSWTFRRTEMRMQGRRILTFNGVNGRNDNPNYRHVLLDS